MDNVPRKLLRSKYRKELWANAQKVVKVLEKMLPVSEVYLRGSFTTKKKRPADVDFIIALKIKNPKGPNGVSTLW